MGEAEAEKHLLNNIDKAYPKLLDSLDKECNALKHTYDACFNTWFAEKFLKGGHRGPSPCDEMLLVYSECVKKAIKAKKIDLTVLDELNTTPATQFKGKEKSE